VVRRSPIQLPLRGRVRQNKIINDYFLSMKLELDKIFNSFSLSVGERWRGASYA